MASYHAGEFNTHGRNFNEIWSVLRLDSIWQAMMVNMETLSWQRRVMITHFYGHSRKTMSAAAVIMSSEPIYDQDI